MRKRVFAIILGAGKQLIHQKVVLSFPHSVDHLETNVSRNDDYGNSHLSCTHLGFAIVKSEVRIPNVCHPGLNKSMYTNEH